MLATVLSALKNRSSQQHVSAWQKLLSAAEQAAADSAPADLDGLAEAMLATNKTLTDFEALAELMKARQEKLALAKGRAEATASASKKRAAFESEREKFREVEAEYKERAAKLLDATLIEESRANRAAAAEEWLCDPRNVPGPMGVRYQAALNDQQGAREEAAAVRREVRETTDGIRQAENFVKQFSGTELDRSGATGLPIRSMDDSSASATKAAEWSRRLQSRRSRLKQLEHSQKQADAAVETAEAAVQKIQSLIVKGQL